MSHELIALARAKVKLVPNKLLLKMKCPILRKKWEREREKKTERINDGNDSSSSHRSSSSNYSVCYKDASKVRTC